MAPSSYFTVLVAFATLGLTSPVLPKSWTAWAPTSTNAGSGKPTPSAIAPPYLNELAVSHGKLYLGSATDQPGTGEDSDIDYQTILNDTKIFGQITPANGMKGFATEPQLGKFNYTMGQVAVDIAKQHGKYLRCHNLIWASQQPEWLTDGSVEWTRESLLPVMQNHISTLIHHWADVCHAWDVVNEAYASNGSLSASPWLSVIGDDYVHLAFKYAHDAVKSTGRDIKIYYNDYGIESPGPKINAVYQLVRDLASQGVHISVGLESHFTVLDSNTYDNQVAVMQGLQQLGVTFAITELDVRFPSLPPNATYSYEAQAKRYWESVSACMKFSNCEGITVWDFDDKYSWIPQTFEGEGDACLYNADLSRKPAYQAVADALQGKACSVCS